jgi:hypothetical protein
MGRNELVLEEWNRERHTKSASRRGPVITVPSSPSVGGSGDVDRSRQ